MLGEVKPSLGCSLVSKIAVSYAASEQKGMHYICP